MGKIEFKIESQSYPAKIMKNGILTDVNHFEVLVKEDNSFDYATGWDSPN